MKQNDINRILALPANTPNAQYGAKMGRRSQKTGEPEKLLLQKLRMVSGDYDTGGVYWGGGSHSVMWCAFSPASTKNPEPIMVFVRASNRDEAKERVMEELGEDSGFTFAR